MDVGSFYELISNKLTLWVQELIKMLPNIFLAAVVLVTGIFTARKLRDLSAKLLTKVSKNKTLNSLFESVIYMFLIGIIIFISLSILQLDKAVTSILAGAGIIGLALAFAFQDIAANFICGIFISLRKPINIDDIVKIKDYMGKVNNINLRDTVMHTFQGQIVIIPNKDVFQNPIVNYTMLGKRRFDLNIGISYGEDLERVKEITLEAVKGIDGLAEGEETTFYYEGFGDSSINFIIRLWAKSPEQAIWLKVGSEAIMKIKKAYNENDIMIPFPIRTLDFGIKGGVPLKDVSLKLEETSSESRGKISNQEIE
jgi:small conductance mechanosensitive channel